MHSDLAWQQFLTFFLPLFHILFHFPWFLTFLVHYSYWPTVVSSSSSRSSVWFLLLSGGPLDSIVSSFVWCLCWYAWVLPKYGPQRVADNVSVTTWIKISLFVLDWISVVCLYLLCLSATVYYAHGWYVLTLYGSHEHFFVTLALNFCSHDIHTYIHTYIHISFRRSIILSYNSRTWNLSEINTTYRQNKTIQYNQQISKLQSPIQYCAKHNEMCLMKWR